MKIKALTSFCGSLCMAKGEIRECSDKTVLADLLDAGYVEEVVENTDGSDGERKTPAKSGRKRASGEKGADSGEGK